MKLLTTLRVICLLTLSVLSFGATAQCTIEFESTNTSCFGGSDGVLSAQITDNDFTEAAGKSNISLGGASGNYFDYRNGHRFSVIGDTARIDSVTVFPNGTGNIQINIRNSSDAVIFSSQSVAVVSGF